MSNFTKEAKQIDAVHDDLVDALSILNAARKRLRKIGIHLEDADTFAKYRMELLDAIEKVDEVAEDMRDYSDKLGGTTKPWWFF